MPGRSILLFVAALLLIAALASVIAPRQRTIVGPSTTTPPPQLVAPPPAARTIMGTLPADGTIDATVGDVVELTVTADHPDEAQIFPLALHAPVDPDVPGVLEFVADQPGRFAVTLRYSGERVGVLVVRSAS